MSLSLSAVHAQSAAKSIAPESAEAAPSAQEPPKNTESAKEMTTYITNCRLCGVPFALRISAISRSSSESSSGAAHIRRERAFIFSTLLRSVPRSRMRRVCVYASPPGAEAVTTMLDVIVKTSARAKP